MVQPHMSLTFSIATDRQEQEYKSPKKVVGRIPPRNPLSSGLGVREPEILLQHLPTDGVVEVAVLLERP